MKDIIKHFKWLILFCIISPFPIYYIFNTPSPMGFIAKTDVGSWMGYYGAVLGGFMTLAGVWWTIKDQEKKRRLDLIAQYKPILTISSKHVDFIFRNICLQAKFNIKNKGRGEAMDVDIKITKPSCRIITQDIKSKFLIKDDETEIILFISLPTQSSPKKNNNLEIRDNEKFHFIIEITYNGSFNNSSVYKTIADVTIENTYVIMKTPISPKDAINNSPRYWASIIRDIKYIESDIKT